MEKSWKVIEDRFWKQTCLNLPKQKAPCKCLSMLDSIIKANKKYYSQTLLEEWKYVQEKIKIENLTDDDLEKSESDESDNHFNNETRIWR